MLGSHKFNYSGQGQWKGENESSLDASSHLVQFWQQMKRDVQESVPRMNGLHLTHHLGSEISGLFYPCSSEKTDDSHHFEREQQLEGNKHPESAENLKKQFDYRT